MAITQGQVNYLCDCGISVSIGVVYVNTMSEFNQEIAKLPPTFVVAQAGPNALALKRIVFPCKHDQPVILVKQI